jgi:hypothetical protein
MKTKVKLYAAYLHSTIMIPGAMPSLETLTDEKMPKGTKLYLIPQGLLIESKYNAGQGPNKGPVSAIVPFANVKIMIVDQFTDDVDGKEEG